jgi:hypothetical protein
MAMVTTEENLANYTRGSRYYRTSEIGVAMRKCITERAPYRASSHAILWRLVTSNDQIFIIQVQYLNHSYSTNLHNHLNANRTDIQTACLSKTLRYIICIVIAKATSDKVLELIAIYYLNAEYRIVSTQ